MSFAVCGLSMCWKDRCMVYTIEVILAEPMAEVSKEKTHETYRQWPCNTHLNLLSFDFSIEMSTFSLLFFWNLYFLFTFLLKSLLSLYFSFEICTFSLLFYWNLYFLFTFLLKSLLSFYFSIETSTFSYFSIETSTFSLLFYWNFFLLFTFRVKPLLSLYKSIEISAFSLLFFWDLYPHARPRHSSTSITLRKVIMPGFPQCNYAPHVRLHHICTSITLRKAIMPCFPQCKHVHKNFSEKLCPELDGSRAAPAPAPRRTQRLTPLPFATLCAQIYCENTGIRTLPYFQTCTLSHSCHTNYHLFTEQTSWLSYSIASSPALHCESKHALLLPM